MQLPEIISCLSHFASDERPLYLVGGAVRDSILGQPCKDYDIVCSGDVRGIARQYANEMKGAFYILDEARDTSRVLLGVPEANRTIVDFSKIRGGSIREDLAERDFTINAMAVDLKKPEEVIDPFKGGRDLQQKWLRPVGPDSLNADPIRTIRGIRYAVNLNLKIEPETSILLTQAVRGLSIVSIERKRDELFKILDGRGVHTSLQLLNHFHIFEEFSLPVGTEFQSLVDRTRALEEIIALMTRQTTLDKKAAFHETSMMVRLGRFIPDLQAHYLVPNSSGRSHKALLHFCLLFNKANDVLQDDFQEKFALSVEETRCIRDHLLYRDLSGEMLTQKQLEPIDIYEYFQQTGRTGVDLVISNLAGYRAMVSADFTQEDWLRRIRNAGALIQAWFTDPDLVNPIPFVDGNELMRELDISPGPQIGLLLEKLKKAQVSGKIRTKSDALRWIREQREP